MPWWLQSIIGFTLAVIVIIDFISTNRKMNRIEKAVEKSLIDSEINLKVTIKIMPLSLALVDCIHAIENGQITTDERGKVYTQEFGEAFLNHLKEVVKLVEKKN